MSMSKLLFHGWVIKRPGGSIISRSVYHSPHFARKRAITFCTVYGGKADGEDWSHLFRKGYRVAKVQVNA